MNDSLSNENTPYLHVFVFIESSLTALELAGVISRRIIPCADAPEWTRVDRDEVPSICLRNVLGCDLELLGEPVRGYNFTLLPAQNFPHNELKSAGQDAIEVDVSGMLLCLLRNIPEIKASLG